MTNSWKFNIMIFAMMLGAICGTIVVVQYQQDRMNVQPADVLAELKLQRQQIANVSSDLSQLRDSVNHAEKLATVNKDIVDSLNTEISDLKKALIKSDD